LGEEEESLGEEEESLGKEEESLGDEEEVILKQSREYAESKGFALNPDQRMLGLVIAGLAKNLKEKGKAYCPCRLLTGNEQEDAKNVCPCIFHLKELEEDGHCKCRLFFRKE